MSGRHPWPPPSKKQHASDCAVNNEPALRAGPCDCGAHSNAACPHRFRNGRLAWERIGKFIRCRVCGLASEVIQ